MSKNVNYDVVKIAIDYIQGTYKISDFLSKYNLLEGSKDSGSSSILIHCPFHGEDKTPSLSVNKDLNIFKCFSCGKGGKIPNFEFYYQSIVLGKKTSFYKVLDEFIKNDPLLQLKLEGRKLISKETNLDLRETLEMNLRSRFYTKPAPSVPHTFLELSDKLKTDYPNNIDLYLKAIELMNMGLEPAEIYKKLLSFKNIKSDKDYLSGIDIDLL